MTHQVHNIYTFDDEYETLVDLSLIPDDANPALLTDSTNNILTPLLLYRIGDLHPNIKDYMIDLITLFSPNGLESPAFIVEGYYTLKRLLGNFTTRQPFTLYNEMFLPSPCLLIRMLPRSLNSEFRFAHPVRTLLQGSHFRISLPSQK